MDVPDALLDPLAGMQHCGMVAPAERFAELLERRIGELTGEIDRHVVRLGYLGGPGLRPKLVSGDAEVAGDHVLDRVERRGCGCQAGLDLVEDRLGQPDIGR